jgi:hypothetical protein
LPRLDRRDPGDRVRSWIGEVGDPHGTAQCAESLGLDARDFSGR